MDLRSFFHIFHNKLITWTFIFVSFKVKQNNFMNIKSIKSNFKSSSNIFIKNKNNLDLYSFRFVKYFILLSIKSILHKKMIISLLQFSIDFSQLLKHSNNFETTTSIFSIANYINIIFDICCKCEHHFLRLLLIISLGSCFVFVIEKYSSE